MTHWAADIMKILSDMFVRRHTESGLKLFDIMKILSDMFVRRHTESGLKLFDIMKILSDMFVRRHTESGLKLFEIDFVIQIKLYLTRAPAAGAKINCAVARPIHVSNSYNKFAWISSNGLRGRTCGGDFKIPIALKSVGINIYIFKVSLK